jgi:DNA polymerase-3 subunit delta'
MSTPDLPDFLPWQQALASEWLLHQERFAHAWLIHGLPGIGKKQFALAAAASLLCESPRQGLSCGICAACQWIRVGSHPDLRRIRPESVALQEGMGTDEDTETPAAKKTPSKEIRVEQLRALHTWFNTATHRGGWRVALIYPAQALNLISANALLKVLEEPPDHTVFLLVADAPDRLLPTLVSRCRHLPLSVPDPEQCVAWLKEQGVKDPALWLAAAGGAPLIALRGAQSGEDACPPWIQHLAAGLAGSRSLDLGALADQLEKQGTEQWIHAAQCFFVDVILSASGASLRYYPQLSSAITQFAPQASRATLSETMRWLTQQRAIAGHPLNAKLFIHSALQRIVSACRPLPQVN